MDFIVEVYVNLLIIKMGMHTAGSLNTEGYQDENFAVTVGTGGNNENLDSAISDNKVGITTT